MITKIQPLINIKQITKTTVPINLTLTIITKLNNLTINNLINNYKIKKNSHIYNLFTNAIITYKIILTNKKIIKTTKNNKYSNLFYTIP